MRRATDWDRSGSLPIYLPWLDLLRFLACVFVILAHLNPYPAAGNLGHAGVGLFFSLSGYLIGTVLLNGRSKPHWVATFYANRFLRIYPPLLVGLVFFGALLAAGLGSRPEMWGRFRENVGYYLTFTARLSPDGGDPYAIVWTLCVEEYFYLVLPIAVWAFGRRGTGLVLTAGIALLMVPGMQRLPDGSSTWFLAPLNLLAGATLATLRPSPQTGRPWVGVSGLIGMIANGVGEWFHPFGPAMGLVTTLVVWSFATTRAPVPASLHLPVMWGKWSYGIYLVHLPFCSAALLAARKVGLDPSRPVAYYTAALALATLGSTALAGLMFRLVERPALAARPGVNARPGLRAIVVAVQVSLVPTGVVYWLAVGGWQWWYQVVRE
ncbi:MAG TPA: acyltransferase [Gemmataceae bacterium]|nr:acyltransferase [Gemmataceae bacterium]